MRYLVISDVHANLEALDAVLADAAGSFDQVINLGDLLGYGPNPNEVVTRVRELPIARSLVGNHDLAALGALDLDAFNPLASRAAEWTASQMQGEVRVYLENLQPAHLDGSDFALAHASPRDPIWEYMQVSHQGPPNFRLFGAPLCLVGHTHVPRMFLEDTSGRTLVSMPLHQVEVDTGDGRRRILNPGGVGQPRDGDPRAAYGLFDTGTGTFAFRRVPYDIPRTQQKILQAGLPEALAARLEFGY
jgi:diadenosine tetraphosphatase ApaH/serine/threonine PP2A family protein phosphatase